MERIIKLSVLLLALMMSTAAIAEEVYDFDVDGIYYKILENGNEVGVTYKTYYYSSHTEHYVSDYTGDVVIPATVTFNGKTFRVTEIGDHAFFQRGSVTSVTIPSSIAVIRYDAFGYCFGLEKITCKGTIPPTTLSDIFYPGDVYLNGVLHVPSVAVRAYVQHITWGQFQTIIGDADEDNPSGDHDWLRFDENGDGEVNIADVNMVIDAILSH